MRQIFITGTDTDCGKTYVTKRILASLHNAVAIKPVASGGTEDARTLVDGTGLSVDDINPWQFSLPVSPHIAAAKENRQLTVHELVTFCQTFAASTYDTLLVEGAGGLMVPLNEEETWLDFLLVSKIPVLLVVGMTLGCINHALLTTSVLQMHGIKLLGWVANCLDNKMLALAENIDTLRRMIDAPLLATVKYGDERVNIADLSTLTTVV